MYIEGYIHVGFNPQRDILALRRNHRIIARFKEVLVEHTLFY